jgi:hypothetical protein
MKQVTVVTAIVYSVQYGSGGNIDFTPHIIGVYETPEEVESGISVFRSEMADNDYRDYQIFQKVVSIGQTDTDVDSQPFSVQQPEDVLRRVLALSSLTGRYTRSVRQSVYSLNTKKERN